MNDTHSLYYNVDHSSMYGSNLSTVFADSPPPLEEDTEEDHGEFVFSAKNNAVGEAVLNKIEGKLQTNAEAGEKLEWGDFTDFNSHEGNEEEARPDNFVAFADFGASDANSFDTRNKPPERKTSVNLSSPSEINGTTRGKEKVHKISENKEDESDDDFGDFSSISVDVSDSKYEWGDFSSESNHINKKNDEMEDISDMGSRVVGNGGNFDDFSGFCGETDLNNKIGLSVNVRDFREKDGENGEFCNNRVNMDEIKLSTGNDAKHSEFGDISESYGNDHFGGFQGTGNSIKNDQYQSKVQTCDKNGTGLKNFEGTDKVKLKENTWCGKDDNFASFETFNGGNSLASVQEANDDSEDFSEGLESSEKPGYIDGGTEKSISSHKNNHDIEPRTTTNDKSSFKVQLTNTEVKVKGSLKSSDDTNNQALNPASSTDDDFGDFADFSEDSFASFSQNSTSTTTQLEPKTDVGTFSWNSAPFTSTSSFQLQKTDKPDISTKDRRISHERLLKSILVSLKESFPKTFVTLQYPLELLRNLKVSGGVR